MRIFVALLNVGSIITGVYFWYEYSYNQGSFIISILFTPILSLALFFLLIVLYSKENVVFFTCGSTKTPGNQNKALNDVKNDNFKHL